MRERVRLKKSQKTPKDIDGVFIRAHIRRDNIIQKLRHSFGFLTDISRLGRHGLMLTANSSKNNEPTREKISRFAYLSGTITALHCWQNRRKDINLFTKWLEFHFVLKTLKIIVLELLTICLSENFQSLRHGLPSRAYQYNFRKK
jgi:hypothetical protein